MDHAALVRPRRAVGSLVAVVAVLTLLAVRLRQELELGGTTSGTNPKAAKNGTNITVANPGTPKPGGTLKFGLNAETNGWSPVVDEWAGSAYIVAGAIFDHLAEYNDKDQPTPYLAQSITAERRLHGVDDQDAPRGDLPGRREVRRQRGGRQLQRPARLGADRGRVPDGHRRQGGRRPDRAADHEPAVVDLPAHPDHPARRHGRAPGHAGPEGRRRHPPGGHRSVHLLELDPELQRWWSRRTRTTGARAIPYLDGIEFDVQTDAGTRTAALETGSDDAIEQGDPGQIKTLAADAQAGKLQFYTDSGLYQTEAFQAFNTAVPPFNDPLARQIVAYATDRVNLNKAVFAGGVQPRPPDRSGRASPTTSPTPATRPTT